MSQCVRCGHGDLKHFIFEGGRTEGCHELVIQTLGFGKSVATACPCPGLQEPDDSQGEIVKQPVKEVQPTELAPLPVTVKFDGGALLSLRWRATTQWRGEDVSSQSCMTKGAAVRELRRKIKRLNKNPSREERTTL